MAGVTMNSEKEDKSQKKKRKEQKEEMQKECGDFLLDKKISKVDVAQKYFPFASSSQNFNFKCLFAIALLLLLILLPEAASKRERIKHSSSQDTYSWSRESRHVVPLKTPASPTLPPVFDPNTSANVSVTASKTALLSCVVHNLGNNSVSWIRHRDLHILAVGKATYTNDERFQVVSREPYGDWTLKIKYATVRDSGQYDCQISSRPPIGRTLHLNVVEPRARVLRAPEMHVGAGSLINLTCVITYSPEPPEYLYWYHKERVVRADSHRIYINNQLGARSVSQLVIKNAHPNDSGTYTCSPAHSREHSIMVHVVTDGYPAAMQGGSSVTLVGHLKLLWLMSVPALCAIINSHKPYFYM